MNSEELEHSLRAEFESYIIGVKSQLRDETLEFQKKIESDFDEQRARFDQAFKSFSSRFDGEHEFDAAFTESVTEHLRLARDEGAKITANAIAEAESMQTAAAPAANFAKLRDAISDISSKDSQSTILKSLITHAAEYTPRGAFFIIKNEHFVGWKVFGEEGSSGESTIRDIHFPISDEAHPHRAIAPRRSAAQRRWTRLAPVQLHPQGRVQLRVGLGTECRHIRCLQVVAS